MAYNYFGNNSLLKPKESTPPVSVMDSSGYKGVPSGSDIASAYSTPTAKLQIRKDTPSSVPAYNPNDDAAEYLTSLMTSPDEERRLRESSMNRRKVLAVGDALRHIGNIYNASRYAPSQQFSSPVKEEEARYDKERAVRDSRNMKVLSYQQARARQEELARQFAERQKAANDRQIAMFAEYEARRRHQTEENQRQHERREEEDDRRTENKMKVKQTPAAPRVSSGGGRRHRGSSSTTSTTTNKKRKLPNR